MSESMLLGVAVGVFVMLVIGIGLTIYEFHRAGSEPVKKKSGSRDGR